MTVLTLGFLEKTCTLPIKKRIRKSRNAIRSKAITNKRRRELNKATRIKIKGKIKAKATRIGKFKIFLPCTLNVLNLRYTKNAIMRNK